MLSEAVQLLDKVRSKFKLLIVFEVVDDPEDDAETRPVNKPINVWFFFSDKSLNLPLKPQDFYNTKTVKFVPGLTRQTGRDIREFGFTSSEADGAFLYVLAEPAEGWAARYDARQYKLQVKTPRVYNLAVSIEPLKSAAAGVSKAGTSSNPPDKGLHS